MIADNGPQYSSAQLTQCAQEWEFQHTTSSPLHNQSNRKAEFRRFWKRKQNVTTKMFKCLCLNGETFHTAMGLVNG